MDKKISLHKFVLWNVSVSLWDFIAVLVFEFFFLIFFLFVNWRTVAITIWPITLMVLQKKKNIMEYHKKFTELTKDLSSSFPEKEFSSKWWRNYNKDSRKFYRKIVFSLSLLLKIEKRERKNSSLRKNAKFDSWLQEEIKFPEKWFVFSWLYSWFFFY